MSESGLEKEIIVDINPYQTSVELLAQGTPSEIYIERRGRDRERDGGVLRAFHERGQIS